MHSRLAGLLFALLIWWTAAPAEAAFVIRSRIVGNTVYVHVADVAAYYGMKAGRSGKSIVLSGPGRRLDMSLNARRVKINGITADFSSSVIENAGIILMSREDLVYMVDPILRNQSLPRMNIRRIVIDPGHGGKDSGTVGKTGTKEKNIVLRVGLMLKQVLEGQGYTVVLTRSTDQFISLTNRGRQKGDLFISLHCNAAKSASSGIETWFLTPKNMRSSHGSRRYPDTVTGNNYDRLNTRLAYEIQRHVLHYTKAADRGPKRHRWKVLSQAKSPAVLIEMGFLSNAGEERKLNNTTYQQNLARGIAVGIISFHRIVVAR